MAKDKSETPGMATPPSPFYPEGSRARLEFDVSRTLVAAARQWSTVLDSTLKAGAGQNRARWATLMWIEFADGPATTMSLAGILKTQWATIVRTVASLEEEGLVSRSENPADGRSSFLHLTERGRELLYRLPGLLDPVRARALDQFGDAELQSLLAMLNAIRDSSIEASK